MGLNIQNLTVEYRKKALGIDVRNPRFSWKLCSDEQDTIQKSYAITISSPEETVWETGPVAGKKSLLVTYAGKPLQPKTHYQVAVTVSDNHGHTASAATWFETGLMNGENFRACWITHEYDGKEEASPVFTKTFKLSQGVKRARLYATALGVYEAAVNGRRVGDAFLAPGWTNYRKRIQYQTYDIGGLLAEGKNEISFTVGKGWYRGVLGFENRDKFYGDLVALLALTEIELEDGSRLTIPTDESWAYTTGFCRRSELYHGETIDYTLSPQEKRRAVILLHGKDMLVAQESEPVRITGRVQAREVFITPNGEVVLDFGQNLVGFVEARVRCPRGTKIILQHAEVLDKDGNFYTANLRTAKATDVFICSGGEDVFLPSFTFHGFRYLKVEGLEGLPDKGAFTACVLHTDMEVTGSFCCSHPGITQLQRNIQWGQKGNFLDIPTDCPQRDERLGWTGDAQVFASTAAYNMNVALFFGKWLRDLASEQTAEFGVPNTIPNILGISDGAAAWADAATIVPWTMYLAYGDTGVLREQYSSMRSWVEYIRSKAGEKNLWQTGYQYGDWLALDKEEGPSRVGATDIYFIATAFYAYSTEILYKTAELLEYEKEAQEYRELYHKIVQAFQKEYVTAGGRLVSETQTACVLALHFNLIEPEHRKRVLTALTENIEKHNNHLTTGFVGTQYLCHTLTENGKHELAGKILLKHDFPSWLYAVDKGATTIWERWDSIKKDGTFDETGMNSFNHYAYGSIGDWMYTRLAGIQSAKPGYEESLIRPMPIEGITWVRASLETPYGLLRSEWKCENGIFAMDVEIPANTVSTVVLLEKNETVRLGSGQYHFEYPTSMRLEAERYSMESTVREIFDNPLAIKMFNDFAPGMTENPMLNFVMDGSVQELMAVMPPEGKTLFETVIRQLNLAEREHV